MRIVIKDTAQDVDLAGAQEIIKQIIAKPASVLGLATGNTTVGLHEAVVKLHKECGIGFAEAASFNVDEYAGVPPDHPASCRFRIFEQLLSRIDIYPMNCHVPDGNAADLEAAALEYEQRIAAAGGIDLQVLGIGMNGHIGFNEPGTPFGHGTRVVEISSRSLADKADFYRKAGFHPERAITLGIRNIMNARKILLIAKGQAKSEIVKRVLFGPVTPDVPASVLQLHPEATILVDASVVGRDELPGSVRS